MVGGPDSLGEILSVNCKHFHSTLPGKQLVTGIHRVVADTWRAPGLFNPMSHFFTERTGLNTDD